MSVRLLLCGVTYTLNDEALDLSSRFTIEQYPEMQPGIYCENLGPVRLIGAEYKIVTYLSLSDYNRKYELLGQRIKNLSINCKEAFHSTICQRYNYVIWGLYNEISEQRDHMYESLGKHIGESTEDIVKGSRKKRGLINVVGSALHTLFGVCDDSCVQSTTEVIKRTEDSGNRVLHLMKNQITVVKAAVKQASTILNETDRMYTELRESEKDLYAKVASLTNETDKIRDMLLTNEIHNIYTTLIIQFAFETTTISNIVTAARGGVIHSSLMTPKGMAATLKEIAHRLKSTLTIPMGTRPSELYELHKITNMIVYFGNDRLVFITQIPLVTDTELSIYNVIPVPMKSSKENNTNHIIIKIEYPYLAITKDRKQYTTYTEAQMNLCKETLIYRICPAAQPVQENNGNQPCEVSLFNKPEVIPLKCEPRVMTMARNIYHKLRYQNAWLFSVINDTITTSCSDLPEPQIDRIHGHGIIKLKDSSCQMYTKHSILTAVESISISKYLDFIPKTDMSPILEKVPNLPPLSNLKDWSDIGHIKFNNLQEISHSLSDLNKMIDNEQNRKDQIEQTKSYSNINYLIIGILFLVMILITTIYIVIKCKLINIKSTNTNESNSTTPKFYVDLRNRFSNNVRREEVVALNPLPGPPPPSPR